MAADGNYALIMVSCADRVGLVASISGALYDLGVNLGAVTFSVLGTGAEFAAVCELPEGKNFAAIERALRAVPELSEGTVAVTRFVHDNVHATTAHVTHRVIVSGADAPGLVARLSRVAIPFGANIVRLDAETIPAASGNRYMVRVDIWIPESRSGDCLAAMAETARSLGLDCRVEAVSA